MKRLLSGNEAIAYGAYTAGVVVAVGYPGAPSTEILESIVKYEDVDAAWCPNEKVALEIAIGASIAGARTIVAMNHVGLNIAADPLFASAYVGVAGGLVIVSVDDPGMHNSQNEQDNRQYAKFAKIPMLEPSDSAEAAMLVDESFKISEMFDIPVLLRTTTRLNHTKTLVSMDSERAIKSPAYEKNASKYVMIPMHAKRRRITLENRITSLTEYSEQFTGNRVEWNGLHLGMITSGIAYQYVKEAYPEASILKLAMTNPLPKRLIGDFYTQVEKVLVVEELDPFIEDQLLAWDLDVGRLESVSHIGELSTDVLRESTNKEPVDVEIDESNGRLPERTPMLCPGCPHRGIFYTLQKLKLVVTGDVGCHMLGVLPPLEAMDTCVCMGGSIGNAIGIHRATGRKDVVAVIGDSTFVHSGIPSLIDAIYNDGPTTIIIVDNKSIALSGGNGYPGIGDTLKGEKQKKIDIERLLRAIGVESIKVVDPYDLKAVREGIEEEIVKDEPSVIVSRRPCLLIEKKHSLPLAITEECDGCMECMQLGCPALLWKKGKARIEPAICAGCNLCGQVCVNSAVKEYSIPTSE